MNGLDHIRNTFHEIKEAGRAALMPYFTLGYPNVPICLDILTAIADSGADLIELGIPFSDPLADGPTIQHSSQVALDNGINVGETLRIVKQLRKRGIHQPLLLMGYYNPILAYGIQSFVEEVTHSGADGLIIPDLPPEEAAEIEVACQENRISMAFLAAPTSTQKRIRYIVDHSSSFIYLVSLTGVTGARENLPPNLPTFIESIRKYTHLPLAVGFGISTPAQVRSIGKIADGVIVGSALIKLVDHSDDHVRVSADYIKSLRIML